MKTSVFPSSLAKEGGYTLVELMLTVLISGLLSAAVYAAYVSQQRTYIAQEQVAEMQQNIRAALDTMIREIRMAGFDPTSTAGTGITTALSGQIEFTQDLNADGDSNDDGEKIDFGFSAAAGNDVNRDGIPDTNGDVLSLGRQSCNAGACGGYQPIAENIQAIEFRYLDEDGAATATINKIRSVQISILARAGRSDPNFYNNMTYTAASGANWGPYNDNFRRRLLITNVQLRNVGL